jgi:hypothetical protein
MLETIQNRIVYMLEKTSPLVAEELAWEFDIPVEIIKEELDSLCKQYIVHKEGDNYYANTRYRLDSIDKIQKETKEINANYKKELKQLKNRSNEIENKIESIYLNIISLMSIFVAIFSLIVTNANIVFNITQKNMKTVFKGIAVTNLFVVICIIVLLIGIKLLIINSFYKRIGKSELYDE